MWNMYIDNILPGSQSYQKPPGVSLNYCACPITKLIYPGLPKVKLILWLTHFALVNQLDHFFSYVCIAISVSNCTFIVVRINDTHTHNARWNYCCQKYGGGHSNQVSVLKNKNYGEFVIYLIIIYMTAMLVFDFRWSMGVLHYLMWDRYWWKCDNRYKNPVCGWLDTVDMRVWEISPN